MKPAIANAMSTPAISTTDEAFAELSVDGRVIEWVYPMFCVLVENPTA
jgi:hypothetical protein